MTSSFWFRMGNFSEIDVIEHVGRASAPGVESTKSFEYAANTHYYGPHQGLEPKPEVYTMEEKGRDVFNTYGFLVGK